MRLLLNWPVNVLQAPTMYGFTPSVDGGTAAAAFQSGFAEISSDIPVMMGTTLNEMMPIAYGEDLSLEQARSVWKNIWR